MVSWVEECDSIKTNSLFQGVKYVATLKQVGDNLDQDQLLHKDKIYKLKPKESKNTFSKLHKENKCFGVHYRNIFNLKFDLKLKHRKECFYRGH